MSKIHNTGLLEDSNLLETEEIPETENENENEKELENELENELETETPEGQEALLTANGGFPIDEDKKKKKKKTSWSLYGFPLWAIVVVVVLLLVLFFRYTTMGQTYKLNIPSLTTTESPNTMFG